MNYTEDQITKAIAPYMGCEFIVGDDKSNLSDRNLSLIIYYKGKPLLKPLSAITDEHACEVARLAINEGPNASAEVAYRSGVHIILRINNGGEEVVINFERGMVSINSLDYSLAPFNQSEIIDLLRYLGYDIPSYHLGGKTLIEAGLAVDSTQEEVKG